MDFQLWCNSTEFINYFGELISLCGEGISLCDGERIRSPVCVLVGGCGEDIGLCNGERIRSCVPRGVCARRNGERIRLCSQHSSDTCKRLDGRGDIWGRQSVRRLPPTSYCSRGHLQHQHGYDDLQLQV